MSKKNNLMAFAIMFAAVVISGALIFVGIRFGGQMSSDDLHAEITLGIENFIAEQNKPPSVEGDFSDDDAFIGDKNAPVTIVEFSEFQCPFCAKFYNDAYQEIKEKYVETGKVKVVFRDFPLNFHKGAYPAALATECVREQGGDEMFFDMHDLLFEDQSIIGGEDLDVINGNLADLAYKVGADLGEYNECVISEKYKDDINGDIADAQRAGVTGTPAFIVNGALISGALPFATFEDAIEEALEEK